MTLFALLLISGAVLDEFQIQTSTPSAVEFRLEFSSFRKGERLPITKFVITDSPPTFECTAIEFDSSSEVASLTETNLVSIGDPIRLTDVLIYPVTLRPSYILDGIEYFVKGAKVRLDFAPAQRQLELHPSMGSIFRSLILNYTESGDSKPAGYLIIVPDALVSTIEPLATWKEKKGWHVEVRTLSQTGTLPAQIRDYIANAYNTWSPRPEYVLLAGNDVPAAANATPPGATDHPYTLIEGDDFLSDLLVGRLPAANDLELATMVAKVIGYERDPSMTDTTWYRRSLMVGANEPTNMTSPLPTKRFVRDNLIASGIPEVDTVFFPMPPSAITNSVNQGALLVNYRSGQGLWGGWPYPYYINSDVLALENGWKLPVVTSITCMTGNFTNPVCFGKTWLAAGNPITPRGAVAFIGASATSTSSRWNNCLDYGIYRAICNEDIYTAGAALYRGKLEVVVNFPNDTTWLSGSSFYCHTYNLLGDPSLEIWTGVPDSFIVTHAASMATGASSFSVQAMNSASAPLEGAMVSLYKAGEVKEIGFTDASGLCDLMFATSTPDTLFVTITKHNFKPYCGHAIVNNAAVYVGYSSHSISDPTGNNNGQVNPGETIELGVTLKNYGVSTAATNVNARLSVDNPNVTITDSTSSYGTINPGATATASAFVFDVSTGAKNGDTLKFNLAVTADQGTWQGTVWIDVMDADLVCQRTQVLDANSIIEPGETSDLLAVLRNSGALGATNVSAVLRSHNNGLTVVDSAGYFGNIAAGDSAANNSDHFTLSANSSLTPGTVVRFAMLVYGNDGFVDTTGFSLVVGIVDSTKPLGPDAHGYYAYDNTDTGYPEAPVYEWIEIDPAHGGSGDTIGLAADETKTVPLPFSFKYYGNWYNRISICSDGYIAMDSTSVADMYNWRIPAAGGPPLLISPFWDDLDPNATDSSGSVCYWNDGANHRFVVEHSRIQHIHDPISPTPAELQTFQVILYDPQYYPTQTGDGEIVFQYLNITNDDIWHNHATVGIEDHYHTTGIEYTYANTYPTAAAPLANGRAIKFTTDPPDPFTGVSELTGVIENGVSLQVSPNPFTKLTQIRYSILDTRYLIQEPTLRVYDTSGRLVKSFYLVSSIQNPESVIQWDGTDNAGKKMSAGVYFIVLDTDAESVTEKVVLVD